ncbi:Fis family transcriptional regulator [Pseudolysobacter antarcticus]|uniref:Fis family transcriptional regulator n=1 Tax=Pseudolysobacter antarcticus TaxID=2511995 RepID=A0A411HG11_9GAMM|nr:integrase domain-containing protein [Pseudolysobacter antarcticus]QBB69432.1 Fis family transcriptional regulator [Pseudolysobacter antarcticus]
MKTGWKGSLAAVLSVHNATKFNGTTASAATRDKRSDVLFAGFEELRSLGFRLEDVRSFRGAHMKALGQHWEKNGMSPSTLQGRISIFRLFSAWIGKEGMIEASWKYVESPVSVQRTSINRVDKSWTTKGVDIMQKIAEVGEIDERVAMALQLQAAFALRAKEAYMLRPHLADQGSVLAISRGAKNGRPRTLKIETEFQRETLEEAKALVGGTTESIGDPHLTLAQVKTRYYIVLRQAGITRKNGITSHGLRHQVANDQYEQLTGCASPVRGGVNSNAQLDHLARMNIAEDLGHSREDITTRYLGR